MTEQKQLTKEIQAWLKANNTDESFIRDTLGYDDFVGFQKASVKTLKNIKNELKEAKVPEKEEVKEEKKTKVNFSQSKVNYIPRSNLIDLNAKFSDLADSQHIALIEGNYKVLTYDTQEDYYKEQWITIKINASIPWIFGKEITEKKKEWLYKELQYLILPEGYDAPVDYGNASREPLYPRAIDHLSQFRSRYEEVLTVLSSEFDPEKHKGNKTDEELALESTYETMNYNPKHINYRHDNVFGLLCNIIDSCYIGVGGAYDGVYYETARINNGKGKNAFKITQMLNIKDLPTATNNLLNTLHHGATFRYMNTYADPEKITFNRNCGLEAWLKSIKSYGGRKRIGMDNLLAILGVFQNDDKREKRTEIIEGYKSIGLIPEIDFPKLADYFKCNVWCYNMFNKLIFHYKPKGLTRNDEKNYPPFICYLDNDHIYLVSDKNGRQTLKNKGVAQRDKVISQGKISNKDENKKLKEEAKETKKSLRELKKEKVEFLKKKLEELRKTGETIDERFDIYRTQPEEKGIYEIVDILTGKKKIEQSTIIYPSYDSETGEFTEAVINDIIDLTGIAGSVCFENDKALLKWECPDGSEILIYCNKHIDTILRICDQLKIPFVNQSIASLAFSIFENTHTKFVSKIHPTDNHIHKNKYWYRSVALNRIFENFDTDKSLNFDHSKFHTHILFTTNFAVFDTFDKVKPVKIDKDYIQPGLYLCTANVEWLQTSPYEGQTYERPCLGWVYHFVVEALLKYKLATPKDFPVARLASKSVSGELFKEAFDKVDDKLEENERKVIVNHYAGCFKHSADIQVKQSAITTSLAQVAYFSALFSNEHNKLKVKVETFISKQGIRKYLIQGVKTEYRAGTMEPIHDQIIQMGWVKVLQLIAKATGSKRLDISEPPAALYGIKTDCCYFKKTEETEALYKKVKANKKPQPGDLRIETKKVGFKKTSHKLRPLYDKLIAEVISAHYISNTEYMYELMERIKNEYNLLEDEEKEERARKELIKQYLLSLKKGAKWNDINNIFDDEDNIYVDKLAHLGGCLIKGEPGTGKSFLLKQLRKYITEIGVQKLNDEVVDIDYYNADEKRECLIYPKRDVFVVAPSNTAANNLGGYTVHSAFGLDRVRTTITPYRLTQYTKRDLIILADEYSMFSPKIWEFFLELKTRNPKIKFFIFGDENQIPAPGAKETNVDTEEVVMKICGYNRIKLTKQYRSDTRYVDLCRNESFDSKICNKLNKRPAKDSLAWDYQIAYTNRMCDEVNKERMKYWKEKKEHIHIEVCTLTEEQMKKSSQAIYTHNLARDKKRFGFENEPDDYVSPKWIKKQIKKTKKCPLCKAPINTMCRPSLDRIDNSKPHLKTNCVITCLACNTGRSDEYDMQEWEEHVKGQKFKYTYSDMYIYEGLPLIARRSAKDNSHKLDKRTKEVKEMKLEDKTISNNEFWKVVKVDIENLKVVLEREEDSDSAKRFKHTLDEEGKKWFAYRFMPAYCTTTHKSQGRTIRQEYIVREYAKMEGIDKRLCYVARTRTDNGKKVYVLSDDGRGYNSDNSDSDEEDTEEEEEVGYDVDVVDGSDTSDYEYEDECELDELDFLTWEDIDFRFDKEDY